MGVNLRGKSFNSGNKLLERSGFHVSEITATGRKVFRNPDKPYTEIFFDSGKALFSGQKPHWHIKDANHYYNAKGIPRMVHIPAR